jgi:hypothetical protein
LSRALAQRRGPDGKRRSRWAVVRGTYPELKTTTIKTWHEIVPPTIGRWTEQGPPSHLIRTDDGVECEVLFIALDTPADVKKLLSMDLTGAWINEARETPKAILDGLTARVGRYPPKSLGGPSWFGVLMDTNPPDTDHWWYRLAEESTPQDFAFFAQPSGLSADAENRDNLPAGYYERLMAGKDEDWIKVYVRGEYGFALDGKPIYSHYRDSMHCKSFDLVPGCPLYVGLDFGLTPAAVIGQRTPMGAWRWRYELVAEDMGATRFGALLHTFLAERCSGFSDIRITGDPSGDSRGQTDENTVFQILRAQHIDARPAPTNEFVKRVEVVQTALSRLIDGEPGLMIHPDCRVLRKACAGGYAYRRIQTRDQRWADLPDKNMYSHVAEALQYGMLGAGEGQVIPRVPPGRDRWSDRRRRGGTWMSM